MSSHHPTHAKANPSDNGARPGARLGRFLFPNRPRPPISPELLKHEQERAEARQNRAADKITAFSGSMLFVCIHIIWFASWIGFGVENYPLMPALIWPMNSEGRPVGQVGKGWARQHPQTAESREPSDRLKPAD